MKNTIEMSYEINIIFNFHGNYFSANKLLTKSP